MNPGSAIQSMTVKASDHVPALQCTHMFPHNMDPTATPTYPDVPRCTHNVDPPYTHNYPHVPPSSAFQSMTMEGSVHYPPNTRDHLIGERPPPHPPPHSYCPAFHLMLGKLRGQGRQCTKFEKSKRPNFEYIELGLILSSAHFLNTQAFLSL